MLLFAVQLVEGTQPYFAAGTLAFILLSTIAFNTAGGLSRASGAYVFFYSVLVFIVGVSYKAFLGEPGESNLRDPKTTIEVYVAGIAAMLLAVSIARRFRRKQGMLQAVLKESRMYRASVGCIVFGVFGPVMIGMLGGGASARLNSAFTQLNELPSLAIIIGTMYEVRRSGGSRSMNTPTLFAIGYTFLIFGLFGFSKQGMLTPFFCWLLTVAALQYRFTTMQIAGLVGWTMLVFGLLVPYSQYGRRFASDNPTTSQRMAIAVDLLSHPIDLRKNYEQGQEENPPAIRYYNEAQGFWDRLQFIAIDDALVSVTTEGHYFGYLPITNSFVNAIPRVFYPNKPVYAFGNMYAHEIGGLPDDDLTTGISFSPTAELYHIDGFRGLLIAGPLIWALMFFVLDSLCGDLRSTPWGLLVLAMISHSAPETGIEGTIYMMTFGAEIVTFCALFATWVAPVVAITVLGEERSFPMLPVRPGLNPRMRPAALRSAD